VLLENQISTVHYYQLNAWCSFVLPSLPRKSRSLRPPAACTDRLAIASPLLSDLLPNIHLAPTPTRLQAPNPSRTQPPPMLAPTRLGQIRRKESRGQENVPRSTAVPDFPPPMTNQDAVGLCSTATVHEEGGQIRREGDAGRRHCFFSRLTLVASLIPALFSTSSSS
jgi:hypothetical protein